MHVLQKGMTILFIIFFMIIAYMVLVGIIVILFIRHSSEDSIHVMCVAGTTNVKFGEFCWFKLD